MRHENSSKKVKRLTRDAENRKLSTKEQHTMAPRFLSETNKKNTAGKITPLNEVSVARDFE